MAEDKNLGRPQEDDGPAFKQISFTVDAALLAELGERLVGKPAIALAELVKNSYDADASHCELVLGPNYIEVVDDGHGMTEDEFRDFWMRVGTRHKQQETNSRGLKRPVTGSKGIGRLSVQFLASRLSLETTSKSSKSDLIESRVDWVEAKTAGDLTSAKALYRKWGRGGRTYAGGSQHGTKIRLTDLNQEWDEEQVRALALEIWILQPPLAKQGALNDPNLFTIEFQSSDKDLESTFRKQMQAMLRNWQCEITGEIKNGRKTQRAKIKIQFRDGETFTEMCNIKGCAIDNAEFKIRVFNLSGRQSAGVNVNEAREYFKKFGGIHVFDAGFRLPYYGVDQDWLGIEIAHSHRLFTSQLLPKNLQVSQGMRDLPTLARVFGTVEIGTGHEREAAPQADVKSGNYLQIQISRDRLVENKPYKDLAYAVRWAVDFYATRVRLRRLREINDEIKKGDASLDRVAKVIDKYESDIPAKVREELHDEIKTAISAEQAKERATSTEKSILGALASAGMAAVALEHEIGKELTALQRITRTLASAAKSKRISGAQIAKIVEQLNKWVVRVRATRKIFAPIMDERDRQKRIRMKAKIAISHIRDALKPLLRNIDININGIPDDLRLPSATMAEWQAVFQNVFTNAVNGTLDTKQPRIVCVGGMRRSYSFIRILDNGVGVRAGDSERLFEPFVRELDISDERKALGLGGVGLGLTIVRTIADQIGCGTKFTDADKPFTTAFELSWEDKGGE